MTNERRLTPFDYEARIRQLEIDNYLLSISPVFGVLTRPALELLLRHTDLTDLWVCFCDIDAMKAANSRYGKPMVNSFIRRAIKPRAHDIIGEHKTPIVGQWFSGDEFVGVFTASDALGYAQRVQLTLYEVGMSATFVLAPTNYLSTVFTTIAFCDNAVQAAKSLNHRALIIEVK